MKLEVFDLEQKIKDTRAVISRLLNEKNLESIPDWELILNIVLIVEITFQEIQKIKVTEPAIDVALHATSFYALIGDVDNFSESIVQSLSSAESKMKTGNGVLNSCISSHNSCANENIRQELRLRTEKAFTAILGYEAYQLLLDHVASSNVKFIDY